MAHRSTTTRKPQVAAGLATVGALLMPSAAGAHSPGYGNWTSQGCPWRGFHNYTDNGPEHRTSSYAWTSPVIYPSGWDPDCTGNVRVKIVNDDNNVYEAGSTVGFAERYAPSRSLFKSSIHQQRVATGTLWEANME